MQTLTCPPQQAFEAQKQGAFIIDVREYMEWASLHIAGAELIPLGDLCADPSRVKGGPEIYVLCRSGKRATEAARRLAQSGIARPIVIEGGILAWQAAGLPLEGRQGAPYRQRQVAVLAGALALVGLLAPALRPLAYIAGMALVVSGVFDWRGLDILLGKLPGQAANAPSQCSRQP